jgi:hypothetical protein
LAPSHYSSGASEKCTADDINLFDEYAEGYGYMIEGKAEAIKMVAETEGLFIDPVYTASAMMGLIDLCRQDYFKPDDTVVFLYKGGDRRPLPLRGPPKGIRPGEENALEDPRVESGRGLNNLPFFFTQAAHQPGWAPRRALLFAS